MATWRSLSAITRPPVIGADEPDEHRPDDWRIHAYFEAEPSAAELAVLAGLASGEPVIEELAEEDWVTRSQAGLEPIEAGRFFVRTPAHPPREGAINFLIDAGLAFGTGHHHTTRGVPRGAGPAGERRANALSGSPISARAPGCWRLAQWRCGPKR